MLSTERQEFEDHLGTLCAGFNVPVTELRSEAYWRGLAKMQLGQFARVVEHALGPDGPERIPTATQCWSVWRQVRSQRPKAASTPAAPVPFDSLHCFGNRCLLRFVSETAVSAEALPRLVAEKNRIAEMFRVIQAEEEITAEEVRHAMWKAFSQACA